MGRLSKETFFRGTIAQGDFCPKKIFVQEGRLSKETSIHGTNFYRPKVCSHCIFLLQFLLELICGFSLEIKKKKKMSKLIMSKSSLRQKSPHHFYGLARTIKEPLTVAFVHVKTDFKISNSGTISHQPLNRLCQKLKLKLLATQLTDYHLFNEDDLTQKMKMTSTKK
jgi:hypothetical protein